MQLIHWLEDTTKQESISRFLRSIHRPDNAKIIIKGYSAHSQALEISLFLGNSLPVPHAFGPFTDNESAQLFVKDLVNAANRRQIVTYIR